MSKQRMGDLPEDRVTLKRPFYCCGIDYAGAVSVLKYRGRGAKTTKGYIVIFVCFATKALHLELVSDYTSETFIAAIKRFCSRRSTPKHIHSDNSTNFIGAKRKLGELFKHLYKITNEEKVCYFLSQQEIEWHTIPPLSPHFGGLWEACVKSVKFHLKRVVGSINLTFEEFYTLLTQIEAVLNSRPLVRLVDNDIDSLNVLTPSHFLVGEEIIGPPETVEESKLTLKGRWDIVQKLKLNFWKRWQIDYLNSIQGRTEWKSGT
ncbi:integrase catalytic domain-containing protein [Trichonephila clavipes]|nr:integrase catalytic domain-containing protein [Trichonephila clavipes]